MKYKDIATLSNEDLAEKIRTERDMLSRLRFAHAISPIENPMKIREARKTLARLNTELTKRIKVSK